MSLIASQKASSSNGGDSVTTVAVDTTGATVIVLHLADYNAVTISAISDSYGNSYTPGPSVNGPVGRSTLFYCSNPIVGATHTFTATKVTGASFPSIQVVAHDTTSVFDQSVTHASSSGTSNQVGSITPPEDYCLFVTGICFEQVETESNVTLDSGFARDVYSDFSPGQAFGGSIGYFQHGAAATAKNPLWDYVNNTDSAACMATFKPSNRRFILGTH